MFVARLHGWLRDGEKQATLTSFVRGTGVQLN